MRVVRSRDHHGIGIFPSWESVAAELLTPRGRSQDPVRDIFHVMDEETAISELAEYFGAAEADDEGGAFMGGDRLTFGRRRSELYRDGLQRGARALIPATAGAARRFPLNSRREKRRIKNATVVPRRPAARRPSADPGKSRSSTTVSS